MSQTLNLSENSNKNETKCGKIDKEISGEYNLETLILAIDVGKGTEDILIYDEKKSIENSIQLVVPSTAQQIYNTISKIDSDTIFINGELMAGEPYHKLIYEKCENNPGSVIMTKTAARSLRYNLNQVRAKGVEIIEDDEIPDLQIKTITLSDVNWERIFSLLETSDIPLTDIRKILLSCQDHGEPPNPTQSTRDYRMKTIYEPLKKRGKLEDLLIRSKDIRKDLPRHQSIAKSAETRFPHLSKSDIYVMDSSPAVILGAIQGKEREIAINVGNGHTLAVILENNEVLAIYETHTGGVGSDKLNKELKKLSKNELSHEEALRHGAHGVFIRKELSLTDKDYEAIKPFTLIGPNRSLLENMEIEKVHPGGNMMMAGPIGMIKAFQSK